MDLRTQISLVASILCFALSAVVLLRPRKRRVHWLFALFDGTVGAWYLTTFLARFEGGGAFWERLNLVWAVLLPLSAVQFFRAFLQSDSKRSGQLNRTAIFLAIGMSAAIFTPLYRALLLGTAVFVYVFVLLAAALVILYRAGRRARSRFDRARLLYLALVGTFAAVFTLAEYLPYVGLDIPPVGTVLILVFLYVLSQSILSSRILDLYELGARLGVLTALAFSLAGILWVLVALDPGHFFLHSVTAALVLMLLTEPVRSKIEQQISQLFFRERHDFERMVLDLRRQLANVLSQDDLVRSVVTAFESSRRLTHGSMYLLDADRQGYDLMGHVGGEPARRVELAPGRPFLDRMRRDEALVLENLERELEERRELGEDGEAETLAEIIGTMESMQASVAVALRGPDESYGLICIRDERLRDAYSPEEVQLLKGLAAQASIAVENSRLYQRMKERDRLAALGEMAAGLAHEIRNPLGAIKASAQFLAEPAPRDESTRMDDGAREFLDIIVEEVDRLNRVVSSFLDYARPSQLGDVAPIDVNATVRRTLQLLGPQFGPGVESALDLDEQVPPVRIDAERLRQVLINLALNAVQAMEGHGRLEVRTRGVSRGDERGVEIHVADTGPGIPQKVLKNLFVPFVTTKDRGTGLGLAISQRIASAAGGLIEVRSSPGIGTTFVVRLPAHVEERAALPVLAQGRIGAGATGNSAPAAGLAGGGEGLGTSADPGTRAERGAVAGERASSLASNR
ncbi:ATP-binding protein [Sandaracinus amylolyticus]|uniref:ATP-binding protein n=1 Tax=Sandaracinus amylolyticus TaxID=927083 RepID=UPI001F2B3B54|nr:ATP-binding protein [Sandaracinus amylolyticus]UJR80890.1 Nitrogen-specific signal transduction histidine kinase [Sandaracinus amylolyticus]